MNHYTSLGVCIDRSSCRGSTAQHTSARIDRIGSNRSSVSSIHYVGIGSTWINGDHARAGACTRGYGGGRSATQNPTTSYLKHRDNVGTRSGVYETLQWVDNYR